jgi:hypothetical protein
MFFTLLVFALKPQNLFRCEGKRTLDIPPQIHATITLKVRWETDRAIFIRPITADVEQTVSGSAVSDISQMRASPGKALTGKEQGKVALLRRIKTIHP